MEKSLIIQRLEKTLDMLKKLPSEQFAYNTWVQSFDYENKCGTVCCVLGWYPKYFPEAGIAWNELRLNDNFNKMAMEYHGIKEELYHLLFIGVSLTISDATAAWSPVNKAIYINHRNGNRSNLPDVIKVWEVVIDFVKDGTLEKYLTL